jgi:F-type H+-transporting ATPase subunit b
MPELNYTVFIQIVNFLLFIFLLNIIVYRPIKGILNKRKEGIDSSLSSIDEWKRKIEKYFIEIEEQTELARKQGLKERIILRDSGLSGEKELLQGAYSQVDREIEKAKNEIMVQIDKARVSLQEEIESYSIEMAEKIIGRALR